MPLFLCFVIFGAFSLMPAVRAEIVQMRPESGGGYTVPVRINDTITLPFLIDTGATNVVVTDDVALTLIRSGAITKEDFIGTGTAVLADGSSVSSPRIRL